MLDKWINEKVSRKIRLFKALTNFNRGAYHIALGNKLDPDNFAKALNGEVEITIPFAKAIDKCLKEYLDRLIEIAISELYPLKEDNWESLESIVIGVYKEQRGSRYKI
ncbi:MAG: hypothetical protein KAW56_10050 [Candidatus Marinimicrobia bacterium]|nr:hypothetical protein [Candidatus Neomarinimicrobiota bacterium]